MKEIYNFRKKLSVMFFVIKFFDSVFINHGLFFQEKYYPQL